MLVFFVFTHKFRKNGRFNFQVQCFSFQSSEISENFAFLHIFQIYQQQSCSLLGSNSYLASIQRFEPVFSLSFVAKSLLGLTQVPDKYRTGLKQVQFGNYKFHTSIEQVPNKSRLEWDRAHTEPEQDLFGIR